MDTVEIAGLTNNDFQSIFKRVAPVAIVGSGVSCWEPTQLPTGQGFSKGIWEALFAILGFNIITPLDWNQLYDLLCDVPFEILMERCPNQQAIGNILSQLYSANQPNPIHKALATLTQNRVIHSIITTNYDLALDVALAGGPLNRIVKLGDIPSTPTPVYFKVHGSADEPATMIFSLTHESKMNKWKQDVIHDCIGNRPILLIGYSGFDFELCPELAQLSSQIVVWNFFSEDDRDRSPGLQHLIRSNLNILAVIGDMRSILKLMGSPVVAKRSLSGQSSITNILRTAFTNDELLLWRIRVLNNMGHSRLALDAIKTCFSSHLNNPSIALEYAQALFHHGQYLTSASEFLRASTLLPNFNFQLLRQLDASDAYRCYGDHRRAQYLVKYVLKELNNSKLNQPKIRLRAILKQVLILNDLYKSANRFFLGWAFYFIKLKAQKLILRGAPMALKGGEWMAFQQFSLWADRLNISLKTLGQQGGYEPLPLRVGYRHLGYPDALLVELCDRATKQPYLVTRDEIDNGFSMAVRLGSHPSAWKVAKIAMRQYPTEILKWRIRYKNHLKYCQYKWQRRLRYRFIYP